MATPPLLPFFIFSFFSISAVYSTAGSLPQATSKSLSIAYIQKAGDCNYRVNITTSCSSPFHIRAEIGLLFGDAHGNQIYEPKLEVESNNAFSKCSKDIFELKGPCTDQICFFYLYKNGSDDWIPEVVEISSPDNIDTVKYKYNSSIPHATWYGFDDCQYFPPSSPSRPPPPPPVPSAAGFFPRWKWPASVIPVILCSAVL